ncbi:ABC transporter permease [Clostridium paraputrificum]|uniref:ABC transporter permease n=1 Tax=Clostridium TaxID=1485 RepID=UPI003D34B8D7
MDIIVNVLEQASLFGLVAMGVYITYKILDFPDLSVDGTYPLGACIAATLLVNGVNPFIATIVAMLGGAVAGFITAYLHVKLKITNLMSGILVMIGLYSVNLTIMGKSNTPLFSTDNLFKLNIQLFGIDIGKIILTLLILVILKILLDLFMKTKIGFLLFAVGDNEQVVTSLGVNKNNIKILGLMISNSLVALAGGLTAQYQGFADVGMGTGIVVKGLACVIIGTSIFSKIKFIKSTTQAIIGTVVYYGAISIALRLGLSPNLLNLLTATVIVVALSSQNFKFKKKDNNINRKGGAEESAKDQAAIESIQS